MNKTITLLLDNWKETRQLTIDFINFIPVSTLNKKLPRQGLNTFAKQVFELADIEITYSSAITKGKIDFSKTTDGSNIKRKISKSEMLRYLDRADKNLLKAVSKINDWNKKMHLFGKELPRYAILELITRHETLHHGQFIAYGLLLKLKFPQTWIDAWAIPQDVKK